MIAYQIVDFDNPVSVEYHKISKDSFRPAIEKGLISEIRGVQCVTPKTLHKYEDMFNWCKDKTHMKKFNGDITPTEKAGNISHWLLMKEQSKLDVGERFFIMEHDAFMLNSFKFEKAMDFMLKHDLSYANLGLFMSCYSYNTETAAYCWYLLTEGAFPINCGPYGVAERLFKTYADRVLKPRNYDGKEYTFMTHYKDMAHIGFGKTAKEMFNVYNWNPPKGASLEFRLPSTQVISKRLSITQEHSGYAESILKEPWKRSPAFAVLD